MARRHSCTHASHARLRASRRAFVRGTETLGVQLGEPAGGAEDLLLGRCRRCNSTIAYPIGRREALARAALDRATADIMAHVSACGRCGARSRCLTGHLLSAHVGVLAALVEHLAAEPMPAGEGSS